MFRAENAETSSGIFLEIWPRISVAARSFENFPPTHFGNFSSVAKRRTRKIKKYIAIWNRKTNIP
jgi:hypothetical protein